MPSFSVAFKALLQLGLEPLALNALYKFGLWTGHYRRTAILDKRSSNVESANIFSLFSLPSRAQLTQTLGAEGKAALIKDSDEIVDGNFRMFGGEPVPLQLTGNWPLVHWTDFETGKAKLEGDIKFIWEPARFGWAFALGRAYHITQENIYAETFWKYFDLFIQSNPPYFGPHWMNGQEVAIRLMSLLWAAKVFEAASASSPARRERLIQSVAAHARRIPPTLIYARSQNNNHLITEAAGLYTAGLVFKDPTWGALGWRWLNWSLQHQISSYGEYVQHSMNYHRLMLQTALWINAIKEMNWPQATAQALARASHWAFSMLDPASGRTPNLGANDGSLILPLSVTPFNDFRPTVQAAARAFLKTQMPAGVWDEMSLWLGFSTGQKTYEPDHYLSENLRGMNSWGYLRASRFKSRLSHMDQLHFDLWWRGDNVAQDAGTYLYNADAPWDNSLVSARVHNTVTVDGRDQMARGGRFLTLDWFPAYSKNIIATDENILGRMLAYHKGYRGIRHERTVTVYKDERWAVEDQLTSQKPHIYRLHWLLMDGEWEVEDHETGIRIRIKSPHGWITLLVNHTPHVNCRLFSLARAGELLYGQRDVQPIEGWVSTTYGYKVPALSLVIEVASSQGTMFTSEFVFPK